MADRIDRRIQRLPGLERLTLVRGAVDRHLPPGEARQAGDVVTTGFAGDGRRLAA
jgi:hypothetical protein